MFVHTKYFLCSFSLHLKMVTMETLIHIHSVPLPPTVLGWLGDGCNCHIVLIHIFLYCHIMYEENKIIESTGLFLFKQTSC